MLRKTPVCDGAWRLLDCAPAWEGNWTVDCFLAFAWEGKRGDPVLAVVNYADHPSQCHVRLPFPELAGRTVQLKDAMSRPPTSATGRPWCRTASTWTCRPGAIMYS